MRSVIVKDRVEMPEECIERLLSHQIERQQRSLLESAYGVTVRSYRLKFSSEFS